MLETKIADRLKQLNEAEAAKQQQLEDEMNQAQQTFEMQCQAMTDLAIAVGVAKDVVRQATYGESKTPYAVFPVAGLPCGLELRERVVSLLVNGQNQGEFNILQLDEEAMKGQIEQALVEAIANYAHKGGEVQLPGAKDS